MSRRVSMGSRPDGQGQGDQIAEGRRERRLLGDNAVDGEVTSTERLHRAKFNQMLGRRRIKGLRHDHHPDQRAQARPSARW